MNIYPLILIAIAELNARLFFKNKLLASILPILFMACSLSSIAYIYKLRQSKVAELQAETKKRTIEGWLGDCDTYRVKDSTVLYENIVIQEANFKTIKYLDCNWAADDKYVYHNTEIFFNSDPKTFEVLNWAWEKDKNHVFYRCKIVPMIDAKSFEILGHDYSRDNKNVYFYDKVIQGADPTSFEIDENTYIGKDKNGTYNGGKKE